MNVTSEQWENLTLALVGMYLRESASNLVSAVNLINRTSLEFDPGPLIVWATCLADAAHEFDKSDQRMPKTEEYQHGPATEPI